MDWNTGISDHHRTYDSRISKAGSRSAEAINEVRKLNKRIDRLTLACQSMWELIRDNTSLTEEDFETKILEVDLRDGTADGKMSPRIEVCPSCGKKTNSTRATCLYCGEPVQPASQFA